MVISKKKENSSLEFSLIFFNFRPKSKVFSTKKKSSPKFGNYFLQFDHCHCPKIFDFAQIFSCHCPKNFNFAQILETWVSICPPCPPPPAGTAMIGCTDVMILIFQCQNSYYKLNNSKRNNVGFVSCYKINIKIPNYSR